MCSFWESLTRPWQVCLEEAWDSYCTGSIPIGACVIDADGRILSRGRNRIAEEGALDGQVYGTILAHAELNALIQLDSDHPNRHDWILYTTTEPCPLCLGALYMSGLRRCCYASRDPYAGSANLLGTTPYLRRKPVHMFASERADLEVAIIAIFIDYSLTIDPELSHDVFRTIEAMSPGAIRLGKALHRSALPARLKQQGCPAQHAWEEIGQFLYA